MKLRRVSGRARRVARSPRETGGTYPPVYPLDRSPHVAERGPASCPLNGLKAGNGKDIERLRAAPSGGRSGWPRTTSRPRRAARSTRTTWRRSPSRASARAVRGQLARLADRDDLRRLPGAIAMRQVIGSVRHQARQKRGRRPPARRVGLDRRGESRGGGHGTVPQPGADAGGGAPGSPTTSIASSAAGRPGLEDRCPAQARGPHQRGDRRRAGASTRTVDRKLRLIRCPGGGAPG